MSILALLSPVITSAATATFAENGTGTVYTVTATDVEGTTLTYSLSGTDANLFNITNGVVTFKTAPNFEVPTDNGANNVYDINVIASDGTLTATQAVAITVGNVNEAPVITSAATATFAENATGTVYTVTAMDVDAATTLTYSLSGTDAGLFNINNGAVTFKTAPNFEVPTDNGANNVYDINVIASDGTSTATEAVPNFEAPGDNVYDINVIASDGTLTATQAVAITVTNVNEAPVITSAATATFAENGTGTVYTVTATDVDAATTLTYSLSGTDAGLFNINNGEVTFKTAPNFEAPGDNVYDINVIASDGTLTATQAVAITVTNAQYFAGTPNPDIIVAKQTPGFGGIKDVVFSGAGNDEVDSAAAGALAGNNIIDSGSGNDTVFLANGDRAFGSDGNDTFFGDEASNFRASGGAGNDIFFLGNGSNGRALGGDGNDKFFVGLGGGNLLSGGAGADQFWIVNAELPKAANTILDFQIGTDVIGISGAAKLGITTANLTLTQVGTDTAVIFGGQTLATLTGIQASALSVANPNQFVLSM
ncbi:hypothetical protein [Aphanizomenon sp. UHCC 0183]|uniref:hypothetical protein n=1 Tax=Aphanizomenon sp. UHCC 0183 TaxID=2590028 RepID=UPI001580BB5B|nr:hypothetical protein [Aphanizomenon sp. UHCC 0183]